jgi:hypothetical protein
MWVVGDDVRINPRGMAYRVLIDYCALALGGHFDIKMNGFGSVLDRWQCV